MSGQKLGYMVRSKKNHVNSLEGTVLIQSSWNCVRMFISMNSMSDMKLGYIGSKPGSPDQILEKNMCTLWKALFKCNLHETLPECFS